VYKRQNITWDQAISEIAALWKSTRDANFELTDGPVTVNPHTRHRDARERFARQRGVLPPPEAFQGHGNNMD